MSASLVGSEMCIRDSFPSPSPLSPLLPSLLVLSRCPSCPLCLSSPSLSLLLRAVVHAVPRTRLAAAGTPGAHMCLTGCWPGDSLVSPSPRSPLEHQ
eukprot:3683303-Alexandrium_andersonii.AAC.1